MIRVTVSFNHRGDEDQFLTEWCHEGEYEDRPDGVIISWNRECRTFVPWASVQRVDWDICNCMECSRI